MKKSIVELWRFLGCVAIALHHRFVLGIDYKYFYKGFVFVEFFFMLTGYFTMRHFSAADRGDSLDDAARRAIVYTYKKFKRLFPYIVLILLMTSIYIIVVGDDSAIVVLFNALMEMTLITSAAKYDGALWFLSAMFIVFPLFCCMLQIKSKNFLLIISAFYSIVYYNITCVGLYCEFPWHILRAYAGLTLGVVVYYLSKNIRGGALLKELY